MAEARFTGRGIPGSVGSLSNFFFQWMDEKSSVPPSWMNIWDLAPIASLKKCI